MPKGFIYIIGNQKPVLYIGVTSNIEKRLKRHCRGYGAVFTKKYYPYKLLYFEEFEDILSAKRRERQLKNWHRDWKINLIKSMNPEFKDLTTQILKQVQGDYEIINHWR